MNLMLKGLNLLSTNHIIVSGTPNSDANVFTINVGLGEGDIALNFSAFFGSKKVIMKTQQGGIDGNIVTLDDFPFEKGRMFSIIISFNSDRFTIMVPGKTLNFTNYFSRDNFSFIQLLRDFKMNSFIIN